MLTFCDLFNPFRSFNNASSVSDSIKNQFGDNNSIEEDYLNLLSGKKLSIDKLLPKCLEIAIKHAVISDNLKNKLPNITEDTYLKEVLFSDILISSLIFFRDLNDVSSVTFIQLLEGTKSNKIDYDYDNLLHSLSGKVPSTIKELFRVSKDSANTKYSISTHYPRLLLSIIQNSGDALFAKKEITRHSFALNQRHLKNILTTINDYTEFSLENKAISLEEFHIHERLYGVGIKLDAVSLFLNAPKLTDDKKLSMLIMFTQIILQPTVFGRFMIMNTIYDFIISPSFSPLDSYTLIELLNLMGSYYFPLCRSLFCGYLFDTQSNTDKINFNAQIDSIIHSDLFNENCMPYRISFPEDTQYFPLTRAQLKQYKLISKIWDNLADLPSDELTYHFKYPDLVSQQTFDFILSNLIETCGID